MINNNTIQARMDGKIKKMELPKNRLTHVRYNDSKPGKNQVQSRGIMAPTLIAILRDQIRLVGINDLLLMVVLDHSLNSNECLHLEMNLTEMYLNQAIPTSQISITVKAIRRKLLQKRTCPISMPQRDLVINVVPQ
jgi:hypothetical protein